MPSINQKTLNSKTHFNGVGLHSGIKTKMTLIPAPPNHGIIFKRTDLKINNTVIPGIFNVSSAIFCTTISNDYGVKISNGHDTPDIHGTILLTWALAMIHEIISPADNPWKIIKP